MAIKYLILIVVLLVQHLGVAQSSLIDKQGWARFFSEAPLENIEAVNEKVVGAINLSNGEVAVTMLMRDFEFEKSLMQEHFNENYIESDKYPKATFKGKLINFEEGVLQKDGRYEYTVEGEITIHGVTKPLTTNANMQLSQGNVAVETKFMVEVESFDIDIPKVVFYNIAEEVEVTAKFNFSKQANP